MANKSTRSNTFNVTINKPVIASTSSNTTIEIYRKGEKLASVNTTPTTGQYKVTITSTVNCTAKLENDYKTITVTNVTGNKGQINITINIENKNTYSKTIPVANMLSTSAVSNKMSEVEQTADALTTKFTDGFNMGIIQQTIDGIKVYHNKISGENYTHMTHDGFYIKNKGANIFKVTSTGLEMQGKITGGSINIGSGTFVVNSSGQIKARTVPNEKGQYLDISSSTYKIWRGSKCCMQIGFRDLTFENGNTVTGTPAIYMGADGIDPYGGDSYTGETGRYYARWYTTDHNNSQSTSHANMPTMMFEFNTRYKNANTGRPIASQIKMYGDGDMRIAPAGALEIYTHKHNNAINADGDEELIAKFTSSTSDYYPSRFEVSAVCNMRNSKGLKLADYYKSASGSGYDGTDFMAMAEVRATYTSSGDKYRTLRPHLDNAMTLGSGSYRWN